MTLHTALQQGTKLLEDAGVDAPRLTAEVLLMHCIGCERSWLYAHGADELKEVWWIHYGRYLHQRIEGRPTQYITGRQEFYGREFRVTPDVLIPRPETEELIESSLALIPHVESSLALIPHVAPSLSLIPHARVVDIGTGSGAIAITLALEWNQRVVATDISLAALRVAQANARRLGAHVDFVCADLAAPLQSGAYDVVVSNPPYVPLATLPGLQREVRDHEPALALYGGDDGLAVYRRLIPEAARILKPGGWLLMEAGIETVEHVRGLLASWSGVQLRADLAGLPRVVIARR